MLDDRKESLKYITPLDVLVFYDNKDLKISKSRKSEQYFRDNFEIFMRLFDEHIPPFESHRRETWRRGETPSLNPHPSPNPATASCLVSTASRMSVLQSTIAWSIFYGEVR